MIMELLKFIGAGFYCLFMQVYVLPLETQL